MSSPTSRFVSVACFLAAVFVGRSLPAAVTDEQVEAAIVRMQNWLISQQDSETGRWGKEPPPRAELEAMPEHERKSVDGSTVMATYALLVSGRNAQEPAVERALRYLRENEPWGTYAVSMRAHVWAQLPDSYLPNLRRDAEWLLRAQRDGLWTYGPVRGDRINHSASLYGTLGLWEYMKRGGRTPPKLWQDAVTHYLEFQSKDGGWAYDREGDKPGAPRGSMTAAGLTVLYVATEQLYPNGDIPPPIRDAMTRAHQWLDRHFTVDKNPQPGHERGEGPYLFNYLYTVERVAMVSGLKTIGGKDWYALGAERILRAEAGRGRISPDGGHISDITNTSFGLMFLARGRVPVWINKLSLPKHAGDNRPNDVYNFTRYLSEQREGDLSWQIVAADEDAAAWNNAPVAWLSSDQKIELTDPQSAHLRDYLDLGGLLVANPEGNSRPFADSVRQLARKMYPELEFKAIPPDHPMLNLLAPVGQGGSRNVQVLNNGVRDLIILLGQDWGRDFQANRQPGKSDAWVAMTNLHAFVSERGELDNRLVPRVPPRAVRSSNGTFTAVRVRYDDPAWNIEPRAWEPLAHAFYNATGLELVVGEASLDGLAESDAALAHLAGVDPVELSETQLQAIKAYIDRGGTLLVETIGGRGRFSIEVERQLQQLLDTTPTFVEDRDPLITAAGLDRDPRRRPFNLGFRRYSVLHTAAQNQARLSVFRRAERPAVIVSHDDLSLGAMGVRQWGINGYDTETARELLTTILLTGKKGRGR